MVMAFVAAAIAMLIAIIPAGIVLCRGVVASLERPALFLH
jgi:hypothetical protein